jgi:hypothetical protein
MQFMVLEVYGENNRPELTGFENIKITGKLEL